MELDRLHEAHSARTTRLCAPTGVAAHKHFEHSDRLRDHEDRRQQDREHRLKANAEEGAWNAERLARALQLRSKLIGINNRDLKSFVTSLSVSERLTPLMPKDRVGVSESGLSTGADLARLARYGIGAFLVGESLMRQEDVAAATRHLLQRDGGRGVAAAE